MREQYPFFREEGERTQAVIGEDAAEADLNGAYQKPYAILTQKLLYCKNEQGNFIIPTQNLLGAAMEHMSNGKAYLLWFAFALVVFNTLNGLFNSSWVYTFFPSIICLAFECICAICFLIFIKKPSPIASFFVGISVLPDIISLCAWIKHVMSAGINLNHGNFGFRLFFWYIDLNGIIGLTFRLIFIALPAILALVYYISARTSGCSFVVRHNIGTFSFSPSLYSTNELKHFTAQVKALKAGDTNGR